MFAVKKVLMLMLSALAFAGPVSGDTAGEPIGYVMTVKGKATVTRGGKATPASVGLPVVLGSTLTTGADGSMGVTLSDSTVMSFGPNTELTLDEYQFAPANEELRLSARISRGTLNFISGVIAKLKPEAVELKTPTGTIGVRGTHFLIKVDE